MSGLVRFSPLVFVLISACAFDSSGISGNNVNNVNNANDNANSNANDNTNNNTNNNTGSCGNEILDDGEDCDGGNLNSETCVSQGYSGSGLACDANCELDFSSCDPPVTCGNSAIDPGEDCEGANLAGESCGSLGYHGTGLACDGTCHFDTSVCEANGRCGDANLDPGFEECDQDDVGGQDCTDVGAGVGPLSCTVGCLFDFSACADLEVCDDHTDNDGDSDVDCVDTDCANAPWCLNSYSTEFGVTDERVVIGSLQDVTGNNPVLSFTVSYWLKLNGVQPDWATPIGASSGGGWNDGFGFYHSSGNMIRFWINAYDGTGAYTATSVSNNVWYHVVGTYDAALGSANIKIYLNGAFSASADSQVAVSQSGRPISIGALYEDGLVGFVDEVAFWPMALSPQNVQAIYNGGSPFNLSYDQGNYNQSATLSAYYRMGDQDNHPTITDRAGTHNGSVVVGNGDEFVTDVP